ncbi:MAG: ferredoxin III, nif-specific [Desulfitobacteriaceae bacterium]|nr:ferredoxin III, nif-specific [Desulfitobacteriaceae bacterium]MDI6878187.1 ferredoxin III, nif-specific [Desulfitobacteriaceae bacterium]MDI6913500.1 ferredoxin III, nif-specific [Desulfitobacteriaceae bacterium]
MTNITYRTYGGHPWIPQYVEAIDLDKCLGCGRCVKICSRGCLTLVSYVDEDDTERFIASIAAKDKCIGCQACGKTCVRNSYTFQPLEI